MNDKWFRLFDEGVERHGTDCVKWDMLEEDYGNRDAIALWVADMDFPAPAEVIDAIVERARHGAFGYTVFGERHFLALRNWLQSRHGLTVEEDWVSTSPGVVDSMVFCLRALAKPGTRVAIFSPVYGPFFEMGELAGYEEYVSPLRLTERGWKPDLDNLEDGFKQGDISTLMLCNPHNPVGRVWTREELTQLVALCNRYGVRILSDEIHIDFEMPGYKQTPLLTIPGTEECVMLTSATKTFNLAALRHSSVIAPNARVREKIRGVMRQCMASGPNLFGYYAQTAAYENGAEWLDNLLEYLDGNRAFVETYIAQNLPEIGTTRLEGTYLKFLDMRKLGMEQDGLMQFLTHKAGIAFNNGLFFGEAGRGFVRMNLATQRKNLERAMESLEKAVRER